MINFNSIAKPYKVVVPIFENQFILNKKKYSLRCRNGWFEVEISNNRARALEPSLPSGCEILRGYTHNNHIVFQNFDVAKKKYLLRVMAPLHFNQSQTFEAVIATYWEDKRIYWIQPDYSSTQVFQVKDIFDQEGSLETEKGITPELRSLFLFHSLERDQLKELAQELKQKQDYEKMMADLPSRLHFTFSRAGAELLKYSLSGQRIICDWKIPGSEFKYNSVIDSATFKILEAGYCMSQDDKRHNITSVVKTAEEYEQRGLTYITRR
jgi:hypothetical protein